MKTNLIFMPIIGMPIYVLRSSALSAYPSERTVRGYYGEYVYASDKEGHEDRYNMCDFRKTWWTSRKECSTKCEEVNKRVMCL